MTNIDERFDALEGKVNQGFVLVEQLIGITGELAGVVKEISTSMVTKTDLEAVESRLTERLVKIEGQLNDMQFPERRGD